MNQIHMVRFRRDSDKDYEGVAYFFKHGPKQPPKPLRKKVSERNFWKSLSWGGKLGEKSSQLKRGQTPS